MKPNSKSFPNNCETTVVRAELTNDQTLDESVSTAADAEPRELSRVSVGLTDEQRQRKVEMQRRRRRFNRWLKKEILEPEGARSMKHFTELTSVEALVRKLNEENEQFLKSMSAPTITEVSIISEEAMLQAEAYAKDLLECSIEERKKQATINRRKPRIQDFKSSNQIAENPDIAALSQVVHTIHERDMAGNVPKIRRKR